MRKYLPITATALAALVALSIVARADDSPEAAELPPVAPPATPAPMPGTSFNTNDRIGSTPAVNGSNLAPIMPAVTNVTPSPIHGWNGLPGQTPVYMTADNIRQIAAESARETLRSMPAPLPAAAPSSSSSAPQLAALDQSMLRSIVMESVRSVANEAGPAPSGQSPPTQAALAPPSSSPAETSTVVERVRHAGPLRKAIGALAEEVSLIGRDRTVTFHPRTSSTTTRTVVTSAPAAAPVQAASVAPSAQSPGPMTPRFGLFRR